jgi:hypothetical protein
MQPIQCAWFVSEVHASQTGLPGFHQHRAAVRYMELTWGDTIPWCSKTSVTKETLVCQHNYIHLTVKIRLNVSTLLPGRHQVKTINNMVK